MPGTQAQENALQPLLERAVRESLRELASSAAETGVSKSIECIVRDVAARVVQESGCEVKVEPPLKREASKTAPPPVEPLLGDLQSKPWVLWQESSAVRCQAAATDAVGTASLGVNKWPPHLPALAWAPQADSSSDASTSDALAQDSSSSVAAEVAEDGAQSKPLIEAKGDALPHRQRRMPLRPTRSDGLEKVMPRHHGSLLLASGAAPMRIHEGLTLESHRALHLFMQWGERQGPASQRPGTVLLIAKPGDKIVVENLKDIAAWLSAQGVVAVVEAPVLADQPNLRPIARTFSAGDELEKRIDLVVTVGGDGTLTWAVSRFKRAVPPVLSFAAGSLGFLTPFELQSWVGTLSDIFINEPRPLPLVCRMRLRVIVKRRSSSGTGSEAKDDGQPAGHEQVVHCLNEVLIHRGASGALAKLDVAVDGNKVTVLQGDGVILATPTGSTAYSLAAGGSMVHPGVPCILLTPVSPHSLSFRPAVLPDSAIVSISVPLTARSGAALSVDGKDTCILGLGDTVEVSASPHPVPTICRTTGTADWFASVQHGLQWNGRVEQK